MSKFKVKVNSNLYSCDLEFSKIIKTYLQVGLLHTASDA